MRADDNGEEDEAEEEEEEEEEELDQELADLVREPGVCSYDKGYATMHVFVCRTCSLSSEPHTVRTCHLSKSIGH